jgi:hypothetical protein
METEEEFLIGFGSSLTNENININGNAKNTT